MPCETHAYASVGTSCLFLHHYQFVHEENAAENAADHTLRGRERKIRKGTEHMSRLPLDLREADQSGGLGEDVIWEVPHVPRVNLNYGPGSFPAVANYTPNYRLSGGKNLHCCRKHAVIV